ncbi:MAG TPA: hypothetical protein VH704_10605 [Casimicrobiaceae bacterium]|jgi:hypothetical protein|nr:hypothetical protein [Casimicrobiaceae bacterium]
MSWITALSGRADTVDPSEEDTVINGAPYRPRPFPPTAAHAEAANSPAVHHEAGNRRLDTRLAEELRRRALAVMHAR